MYPVVVYQHPIQPYSPSPSSMAMKGLMGRIVTSPLLYAGLGAYIAKASPEAVSRFGFLIPKNIKKFFHKQKMLKGALMGAAAGMLMRLAHKKLLEAELGYPVPTGIGYYII